MPRPDASPGVASCAICGRPADPKLRSFCSRRCADIDLGRWLTGQYRIPGPPIESEAAGDEADEPA